MSSVSSIKWTVVGTTENLDPLLKLIDKGVNSIACLACLACLATKAQKFYQVSFQMRHLYASAVVDAETVDKAEIYTHDNCRWPYCG
jgi:hypothetical protein